MLLHEKLNGDRAWEIVGVGGGAVGDVRVGDGAEEEVVGGGDEEEVGVGAGGEEAETLEESLLKSLSYASLSLLPSKSLFLAASMSLLSFACLRSTSVCLSFVRTRPSSILVCSC